MKLELQSLRQELKALRETHEITILELAESRDNEQKYKKLNDMLVKGLEANESSNQWKEIQLRIEG